MVMDIRSDPVHNHDDVLLLWYCQSSPVLLSPPWRPSTRKASLVNPSVSDGHRHRSRRSTGCGYDDKTLIRQSATMKDP